MGFWVFIVIAFFAILFQVLPAHAETVQDQVYEIAPAFGQDPELVLAIRHCESLTGNPIHYNDDGSFDIGALQINSVHLTEAKNLGLDLYTTRGNLVFGVWLLKTEGTIPWNPSRKCWLKLIK